MATKTTTLWLTRGRKKDGWYYLCSGSKPRKSKKGWLYLDNTESFCPEQWESLCPASVHLRPGGGPIHIVVQRGRRTK